MKNIIISIFTYERFDSLANLLNQLISQSTKHNVTIIVCDDSSIDGRYSDINFFNEKNITILKTEQNNGKINYWKTVNQLMGYIKNDNFDYLIQLDDDFQICNNFIDLSVDFFSKQISLDNSISAMSLHLNGEIDGTGNRWRCGNSWVDGGAIYTNDILKKLNFTILPISEKRWKKNTKLSSGVWEQVSNRINQLNSSIIKPNYSFLNHNDNNISKMNGDENGKRFINSYNFIGVKTPKDLTIYPINKIILTENKKKSSEDTSNGNSAVVPVENFKKPIEVRPVNNSQITSKPVKLHKPEKQNTISRIPNDIALGKLRKGNLRFGKR